VRFEVMDLMSSEYSVIRWISDTKRRMFVRGLVLSFIAVVAMSASMAGQDRASGEELAGAWRLASLEQLGPNGQLERVDCTGMLVATRDGHFSVQVMERSPKPQTAQGPEQYSQGGYEASFGTYALDDRAHTFTFHVEGALVRSLIGKDLPRSYEISGNRLVVKSTRADEHWRVTWERYP
jgi:hypothetical protein